MEVDGGREAEREEPVGFAKVAGYLREPCCNGLGVWVRGRGLARGEKVLLGSREGGRPHFNQSAHRTRNLLGRGLFANFGFGLATIAGARGSLSVGGGGVVFWMPVAEGKGCNIVRAPPVFSGLI